MVLLGLAIFIMIKLAEKCSHLEKENKELAKDFNNIYKKLKDAESLKQKLETGDVFTDYNNSVNILSDLAKKRKS